ncbi:hypothetical protein VT84_33290 [Gemmata sp. SH-PL17]|uniref:hypothetical protein n=1 Tax=Gemmata sp. SH-PL17 TaxID=1630693 RepID=UPI00078C915E|nr:hypothetical protein [Gemmata sp. SH-PL17]AMV29318.1 hypothetical protein VT84_33290 [Gemmata sp. SH-PL17]
MHDTRPDHDGETFDRKLDLSRLNEQTRRVFEAMRNGGWLTLLEIQLRIFAATQKRDPEASVSARLRDLRKERFGGFTVERQRRGDPKAGLWEYRLVIPTTDTTNPIPPLEA